MLCLAAKNTADIVEANTIYLYPKQMINKYPREINKEINRIVKKYPRSDSDELFRSELEYLVEVATKHYQREIKHLEDIVALL